MEGNGNESSGAIREWEWFFKGVNFGNGNGKDLAGMGGIGNTENHSRTSPLFSPYVSLRVQLDGRLLDVYSYLILDCPWVCLRPRCALFRCVLAVTFHALDLRCINHYHSVTARPVKF